MKNPKYLLLFIICLVLIVVGYRYKDYIIDQNYTILATTECDASAENCFYWDCTLEEDPECDTWPYGKVEIAAYEAPNCLLENDCEEFSCTEFESCSIVECSADTTASWEVCIAQSDIVIEEEEEEIVEGEITETADAEQSITE